MNISPLDIRKHEFRKSLRGFDPDEVMAFLDMISLEFENLIRENSLMKEKVANLDSQLKKYHDIESTLQETLLSAQRACEDTITTSKKQAEVIIREAEVKAASIIEEGRKKLSGLRSSFTEMKIQKEIYQTKLKALINAQLEILEKLTFNEEKILNNISTESEIERGIASFTPEQQTENADAEDSLLENADNGDDQNVNES